MNQMENLKKNTPEKNWKILLVDDEPEYLNIGKTFLEKESDSLKVETANSAEEAITLLKKYNFDAVVSDYRMPVTTGIEFLKKTKDIESEIPFIMLTGRGNEDIASKAVSLGVDRYIKKNGKAREVLGNLSDEIIQTIKGKKRSKPKNFIAWVEVESIADHSLVKYDLEKLTRKIGSKMEKLEVLKSPFNPEVANIVVAYTKSFDEVPKNRAQEAEEWKSEVMTNKESIDAEVIIRGEENSEKTEFLKEAEYKKWENLFMRELST